MALWVQDLIAERYLPRHRLDDLLQIHGQIAPDIAIDQQFEHSCNSEHIIFGKPFF